jgi:ketosteroid isomerase-like protein
MADQTITHSPEAQIRSMIEAWAQAMRAKDAAGVVSSIWLRRCKPLAMIPRD